MHNLPAPIVRILDVFSPLFSRRVFQRFRLLFQAHILCDGRRTVTNLLRLLGLSQDSNYSSFHWIFSQAKWSAYQASETLFKEIIGLLPAGEEVVIPFDTHVERRKGPKIKGLGLQRDAVRSTKKRKVLTPGLLWFVASVSVKIPFSGRTWALPFFSHLMRPKRPLSSSKNHADLQENRRHKTLTEWTIQVIGTIRRWLGKTRKFVMVGDSAFACHKIVQACVKVGGALVSRSRLDARIYDFPPPKVHQRGRPRLVGKRRPLFRNMFKDTTLAWKESEVGWYGGKTRRVLLHEGTGLWYAYGIPPVAIKFVLVKALDGSLDPVVLFSTNLDHSAERIVELFVSRWPLEVTFEESRRHLGIETQRQWSDKAIERITPCILASFSLITVAAIDLAKANQERIPMQSTAWYHKDHITFSDALVYVRTAILRVKYFSQFGKNGKLGKKDLDELILQAAAA